MKLLAGMLGTDFDVLYRRADRRRVRHLTFALAFICITIAPLFALLRTPDLAWIVLPMVSLPFAAIATAYAIGLAFSYSKYRALPSMPDEALVQAGSTASFEEIPPEPPTTTEDSSGFIFISYKMEDLPRILPYMHRIVEWGYPIWYDEAIPGGAEWDALIEEKVSNCRLLLVFLSQEAVESKWVRREIKFADSEEQPILGIRIEDDVDLRYGLRIVLNQYQMIDASHERFSNELKSAIEFGFKGSGINQNRRTRR